MAQDYPSFREHSRAPVRAKVEVRFDERPEKTVGFAANISEGGLFVETPETRPVGTLLRFSLELTGSETVTGFAEVVWIRVRPEGPKKPAGCGIQFRFLEADGRERLRAFIARLLGEGAEEPWT